MFVSKNVPPCEEIDRVVNAELVEVLNPGTDLFRLGVVDQVGPALRLDAM